ncbi:PrsW family intramembrane metalloprotease [Bacillus sp. FJAT-42376]|uniref:glutamic-type intramembrane protease PrsW n=1 Tax=Bacillus sp. FJAT-42376 TaxID=2014076 RepID=UPI000F4E2872|nr:glutamic-type intramembrane protease PrsW [Bacillus sp. FJAT-42376]AZB43361.1 PrsW family intramembrane metalloprotease [Bacillus sp. FJAT-42376]
MIAAISAGFAPGLAILCYFYLKDQFETEPIYMVIRAFIFGMILVFPLMFIQYIMDVEKVWPNEFLHIFFAYGFLEEFFKWFIFLVAIYPHVHFDEHYDGIVYGSSISLGFATLENILFLFANGLEFAMGRAVFPVSSHALFGVIMGYYLGKSKFTQNPQDKKKWLILSLALPVILHGLYDYILSAYQFWPVIMLPFMLFLWWFALHKAKQARMAKHIH